MSADRSLPVPPLLIITDRHQAGQDLLDLAETAFRAGARWLSLREKDLEAGPRLAALTLAAIRGRVSGVALKDRSDPSLDRGPPPALR